MAKFVPRQRKHKVLARERAKESARHEVQDTNQEILPAAAAADKKKELEEKKARLKEQLKQDGAKMSGKKAKRLEKYIDNKLRKDENRELLAKLAERKIDTSLFASSKALGQGRETKKQALSRALREHRAGVDPTASVEGILFQERPEVDEEGEEEDDAHMSDDASAAAPVAEDEAKTEESKAADEAAKETTKPAVAAGSGLKRPLELDDEGRPKIQKRRKRGGLKTKVSLVATQQPASKESEDEDEWGGFSGDEEDQAEDDKSDKSDESDEDESDDSSSKGSADDDSESEEEESSDEESEEEELDEEQKTQRSSSFKAWAQQQRNEALGYQPVDPTAAVLEIPKPENFVPRAPEQDPLPMELQVTEKTSRKVYSVPVVRTPEIQEARMKLPVVAEEQRLMEAIHNHDIVVICGSTGSGKTTQVPQFLYEAGYGSPDSPTPGMIGVTQPRRVAAVSMSKRVADELGDHSKAVAYQIRFEGNVDEKTAIKFMTDGVLLREVAQDITLRKYSAIVIDEAHERSVNTDILIGMLSRVIRLRAELSQEDPTIKPLKLIIMSATLRIEDMTMNPTLFSTPPPVVEVEGRQHPVTIHFARRTHHDYVEEAFRKICRGHKKLPPGGFLVFLTGRNEILQLSKKLKAAFGGARTADGPKVQISATEAPVEVEDLDFGDVDEHDFDEVDDIDSDDENEEGEDEFKIDEEDEVVPLKMQVLPLYSLLPVKEQLRVFEEPPEGTRQIILATNVAETSLTIPGTRFVFDCGRSKERNYDRLSGVQSYEIGWISKASASQRSGRAGRTGPGHCYRLYSSAVYERDFPEFSDPELLRMPIEGIVLQLKAMNLQNPQQANVRRLFNQVHKNFCFLDDKSDAIKLLQVVGEFAHEPTEDWCERHFVRYKVLKEIQQLRKQITDLLRANIPSFAALQHQDKLDPPSPKQVSALKQMTAAGFLDQVAIRADLAPNPPEQFRKPRRAIDVPYVPLVPLHRPGSGENPCVYIHPSSCLAHVSPQECPEYIVYAFLQRATPSGALDSGKTPKTRMHALTDVTGGQLAGLAKGTPLISYGKPIKEVKAQTLGADGATTRECWVVPYLRAENTAGQGWPLPAQKVKQRKVAGKGWVVE
ncbi:P-loop containing nucleoside triphosphate hydrolase protein [Trichoderma longibrachiatum ATCC 18648]|uniref:RNA helicase n=1 Tax=Trichoderma longibrachiatum ATCC 18648 TaxID=983965 RepID=A0A2T4CB44_TRILO|nr:P-loop containing nucleoside triphosphate hydrolase protein [Trichoderma longibrachiatum ATCC 18648]